jgi:hypothetical protein
LRQHWPHGLQRLQRHRGGGLDGAGGARLQSRQCGFDALEQAPTGYPVIQALLQSRPQGGLIDLGEPFAPTLALDELAQGRPGRFTIEHRDEAVASVHQSSAGDLDFLPYDLHCDHLPAGAAPETPVSTATSHAAGRPLRIGIIAAFASSGYWQGRATART